MTAITKDQLKAQFDTMRGSLTTLETWATEALFPTEPLPLPTMDFALTPDKGMVPLTVSTSYSGIGADRVSWDWGDGTAATDGFSASHTYTVPGNYQLDCIASNSAGTTVGTRIVTASPEIILPPPVPGLIVSEKIAGGFVRMPREAGDVTTVRQLNQRWCNGESADGPGKGWEALFFNTTFTPTFTPAPNGDLVLKHSDTNSSYENSVFCKEIEPIDFKDRVFCFRVRTSMHFSQDRRGWACFLNPIGDDDLLTPDIFGGSRLGQNPFVSKTGVVVGADARNWTGSNYRSDNTAAYGREDTGMTIRYDPKFYGLNGDWAGFKWAENLDASSMEPEIETHLISIYLSEHELWVLEEYKGVLKPQVHLLFHRPLAWSKVVPMWGHWVYHLALEKDWLLHIFNTGHLPRENFFIDQHPRDDVRPIGLVEYEVLDTMPQVVVPTPAPTPLPT